MNIQSIVLSRPDRIGDTIISSSALRALRERFPNARVYWLGRESLACLFHEHPALTAYWAYPEANKFITLTCMLKRAVVDAIVHLEPNRHVERAAVAAGIPYRIGFDLFGKSHLTHALPHTKKQGLMHEAAYCFQLLECLGIEQQDVYEPWIQLNDTGLGAAQELLQQHHVQSPFAVMHLSAHGTKVRISPVLMASIARRLIDQHGSSIVLVGAHPNQPEVEVFISALGNRAYRVVDLCGKAGLGETAWILQQAMIVVSRDSGPAHLAAAMGAPTLSLFAEPSPSKCARRWLPLGKQVYYIENDIRKQWWESDKRFAKRNAAMFDEAKILAVLDWALAQSSDKPE